MFTKLKNIKNPILTIYDNLKSVRSGTRRWATNMRCVHCYNGVRICLKKVKNTKRQNKRGQ